MKLLLTSGGITNRSSEQALVELLGPPFPESKALCLPTASYAHPWCTPRNAYHRITGQSPARLVNLGWKSVGILELTALPSIGRKRWGQEADALLVDGGDALYLSHWMRESGLAGLLPSLKNLVWVCLSAGSMVMTPRVGQEFTGWPAPTGSDETLGFADFSIFPHLNSPQFPENTLSHAEKWAAGIRHRRCHHP